MTHLVWSAYQDALRERRSDDAAFYYAWWKRLAKVQP